MSSAALDRLLAILLVAQLLTGLLTLRAGVPAWAPLFVAHGLLGGALLVAAVEKLRRSIGPAIRSRRWVRLALGATLSLLVAAALVGGFAWVASGRILSLGPWTVLTLHVWAALAVVPIAALHLLPRRWRLLRPPRAGSAGMSRRTFLGVTVIAAAGAVAWGAVTALEALQRGVRRFTGSRWLPAGGIPPPTTFYGEPVPPIDAGAWRLRVTVDGAAAPLQLDGSALAALGVREVDAVLDCTSGWAIETRWRGTPLAAVVASAGADPTRASVWVRSVTGWYTRLWPDELGEALLATHVAGQPLPVANGAPLRLVAPGRRGLDWVKWVAELEVRRA